MIFTANGAIYHCTGKLNGIPEEYLEILKQELNGATVTHNHPMGSDNEYSFSHIDIASFVAYKIKRLRGIDEKFIYELTRNANDIDEIELSVESMEEGLSYKHWDVIRDAIQLKIGYRRWRRE